ncbi:MAG: AraC family transcriptional regulator [Anaerocolumna sp.]
MRNNFSYEYLRDHKNQIECFTVVNNQFWPHFHSSLEIIYVTEGELKITLNGQVHVVKKHGFLIVPSYYIHSYATEVYSNAYIIIIPLDSIPSFKNILHKKTFLQLHIESTPWEAELKYCLDAILKITEHTMNSTIEPIIKGQTYVFLGLLIEDSGLKDITDSKMISLAQEILIYIQDHYLLPVTLDDISNHFGYSKSRFSHIFSEYFDCKLIEYINGLRCRHALKLLEDKTSTITDIALSSGFDSSRTFYRAFKKCFGTSPNAYEFKGEKNES